MRAIIREAECIGCTKCIQACPVDAIIGANKLMHTVITDVCTGCEKCIEPCPVDCIDLIPAVAKNAGEQKQFEEKSEQRCQKHEARLTAEKQQEQHQTDLHQTLEDRKAAIQQSLARTRLKTRPSARDN